MFGGQHSATLAGVESMSVTILSIRPRGERLVARAQARAEEARIWLEVEFDVHDQECVWERARDEALRYLDIA